MRRLAAASVFAAALALATAAAAKGPSVATVCGASGCTDVRGERTLWSIYGWWDAPFSHRSAPSPAPFYRFRLRGGDGGVRLLLLYAPSRRAMRISTWSSLSGRAKVGPYWRRVPPDAVTALEPLLVGVRPFRAPPRWPR
jgi:hypothetical protein